MALFKPCQVCIIPTSHLHLWELLQLLLRLEAPHLQKWIGLCFTSVFIIISIFFDSWIVMEDVKVLIFNFFLLFFGVLQSVSVRVAGRASKAWTFHASSSYMQSPLESRFRVLLLLLQSCQLSWFWICFFSVFLSVFLQSCMLDCAQIAFVVIIFLSFHCGGIILFLLQLTVLSGGLKPWITLCVCSMASVPFAECTFIVVSL